MIHRGEHRCLHLTFISFRLVFVSFTFYFAGGSGIPCSPAMKPVAASCNALNEVLDKITSPIRLHRSKNLSKIFRSFSKTFRLFRDFESFSRNRSRRDDSFGPKIVGFRATRAIFPLFEVFFGFG